MSKEIDCLKQKFENSKAEDILSYFIENYSNKIALASSLSAEDQIITKLITDINPKVKIFTLDTGRHFPEFYELIEKTNLHYKINIKIYFPDQSNIEKMVDEKGINLFYNSIEDRKLCCFNRKVLPLKNAFKDLNVWICGLRKEQSITRQNIDAVEWDDTNNLIKINPLINWSTNQVWEYIKEYKIPYNTLHDKGYPSIGCQPCTIAVKDKNDFRSGRWWWENPEYKECGLHK